MLDELRALVGEGACSDAPEDLIHWGRDWTRAIAPRPLAVVWPATADHVGAIVQLCARHGISVVPSGGRTGLAAGAVASNGELVLSLDRLRQLGPVDALNCSVTVGAGVPNQVLQDHCLPYALCWPIDLASKGSSSVGGNLATNAGGIKVLRYGHARNWVLGLEIVTARGQLVQLGGALHKDNSGYALQQLVVGSEGTLAIITAATLALAPLPRPTQVGLVACHDLQAVLTLFGAAMSAGLHLHAFEYFSGYCLEQVLAHTGLPRPVATAPAYALVQCELRSGFDLASWLVAHAGVRDGTVAGDHAQAAKLWQYRERITESLQAAKPHKNDIAVPVSALPEFAERLQVWLRRTRPGWQVAVFGHVGDGNLHINTLRPLGMADAAFLDACAQADSELFELVAQFGGSLSAEHGIGLHKKAHLAITRSHAEIGLMRALKLAWDPQGLLNPGKIFDMR